MTRGVRAWLSLAWLVSAGCSALPEIAAGTCGNTVIESGENCDGFGRGEAKCRPPGAAHACHLDCSVRADATRPACPAGFGCDADDVCRAATGGYQALSAAIEANATRLIAADFDGDGRGDLLSEESSGFLGSSKVRVHYFGRDARVEQSSSLQLSALALSVAQSASAPRAEIVFSDGRVGVLLGQPDRNLIAGIYPTYVLPDTRVHVVGPLLHDEIEGATALLVLNEQAGRVTITRPDFPTGGLLGIAQIDGGLDQLAGEPVLGDVFEDPLRYPCSDLGFALRGGHEVTLYSLCETDPDGGATHWREPERTRLELPSDATVDHGPLLADLDGDGHLDVMVGARTGDAANSTTANLYVAYGDGRQLAAFELVSASVDGASMTLSMPIAAGDITGDALADLVYPEGFLLSRGGTTRAQIEFQEETSRLGSAWTQARIADFNGNGLPDVVAASRANADIDFFNGTGSERMNPFLIPTTRPVEYLATGDLDGDLITDIAFAESGSGDEPPALSVAFGTSRGAPSPPATIAHVAGLVEIGTLPYGTSNSVDELFVTYERPAESGGGSALAQFATRGDRSFTCMVELTSFAADGSLMSVPALALAVGAFVEPGQRDVLLFGSDLRPETYGMWLLPNIESSGGRPEDLGFQFDSRLLPITGIDAATHETITGHGSDIAGAEVALRLAAGDLERDGLDELVLAGPDRGLSHCLLASAKVTSHADDTRSLDVGDAFMLDEPCSDPQVALALSDLDGDGAADLLLLTGGPDTGHKLVALWNDGAGHLSAESSSTLSASGDDPRAFAVFTPERGAAAQVAYVTPTRVHLLRATAHARALSDASASLAAVSLRRGTGIAASDVDGDGITDLVVADDGNLRVLHAELEP